MIQTYLGPVDLRRDREPQKIVLNSDQKKAQVVIKKGWLAEKRNAKDSFEVLAARVQKYRSGVLQAMIIAAATMELEDVRSGRSRDPETGALRTPEKAKERQQEMEVKRRRMQEGSAPVPMKRLSVVQNVMKQDLHVTKHVLMKRSHKLGMMKRMWFAIDNGKLKVFKYHSEHAKVIHVYNLADDGCECKYENEKMPGLAEPFPSHYKDRLKVNLRDRPHGPVYLYDEDPKRVKSWERAVKMSKYLVSASDREALAFVVGRLTGSILNKAWQALFNYKKEMLETKQLVKNLAMRLMRSDLSRGWTKAKMVYVQRMESDKLRREQQEWAAKFLKEKMERIGQQTARTPKMIRHSILGQIQTKFRHYRQEKIMDRQYPLGASVTTRLQLVQSGLPMGAAFTSLTRDDALHLVLNDDSRLLLTTRPDIFHSKKSTYSEVTVPVCQLHVAVSESFTMLAFAELDEEAEHSHLAKSAWSHFINLDQISSVVLHSERMMRVDGGRHELQPSMTGGVWFTINGPRVCWCRALRTSVDPKTKEVRKDLVGAINPLAVGSALAKGERLRWLKVSVTVRSSNLPRVGQLMDTMEEDMGQDGEDPETTARRLGKDKQTCLVLHILGRKFESPPALGDTPVYQGRFEAEVPISYDEQALAALDESEVGVDIVEWTKERRDRSTIFAGKSSLWKVFHETYNHFTSSDKEEIVSLAQTVQGGAGRVVKRLPLVHSLMSSAEKLGLQGASIELELTARVQESIDPTRRCISPELQGRGPLTALYSTHRGAWYDPKLGEAKFFADKVANFVEVAVKKLDFPLNDKADPHRIYRYHVMAKCNGITATTTSLHRSREIWKTVAPVTPESLDFQGTKLFLPLPPGAWCAPEVRPEIDVAVMRCAVTEDKAINYDDLVIQNGKPGPPLPAFERVYHATVSLDGMSVDTVQDGAQILLGRAAQPANMVHLLRGETSQVDQPASLTVNAALRDRDYVRLHGAAGRRGGPQNDIGQGCVLCVGDRAMLRVEEPLSYPQTELEFRRRALPGTFDASQTKRVGTSIAPWLAPLRDPSLSHEYTASRLELLPSAPPFKQRYLPTNCEDVIPHKYVLPGSELDFLREARPGVFWRILDRLADKKAVTSTPEQREEIRYQPIIVEELSHLIRLVPSTVLAVYANDTCDLELAPSFIQDWEKNPAKRYTMPGAVVIKKFQDTSAATLRTAPVGAGDVTDRYRLRVVLREVPLSSVISVQAASFNVYDASFGSVDDAIRVPPGDIGNDVNPRIPEADEPAGGGRRGGVRLHAGPVPADAGPTCLYEWSVQLHAESEDDMYHFLIALRQSARMDLFQQLLKLDDWQKRGALSATSMPYRKGAIVTSSSGHLEVILVEAKHLKPPPVTLDKDLPSAVRRMAAGELSPLAVFRAFTTDAENKEVDMAYRGSKTQLSPSVPGNSPSWAKVPELETSGGWVFKTPPFDPLSLRANRQEVSIEIVLKQKTIKLGEIRIPVSRFLPVGLKPTSLNSSSSHREQVAINLCDPEAPFHNLWVPMPYVLDPETGDPIFQDVNMTGKVHIMTFWVPQQLPPSAIRLPKKALEWHHYELKPRLANPHVFEHLYPGCDLQVHRYGYNPNLNLAKDDWPMSRSEAIVSHIEELENAVPYVGCGDWQEQKRWMAFSESYESWLQATSPEGVPLQHKPLGELRQEWSWMPKVPDVAHELEDFLRRGVPAARRRQVWMQITLAESTMMETQSLGSPEQLNFEQRWLPGDKQPKPSSAASAYRALVEYGRSFRSEAMNQLQEDLVGASAWEMSMMDTHLVRVRRAQEICIALNTFSLDLTPEEFARQDRPLNYKDVYAFVDPRDGRQRPPNGVSYCESLLHLAFHMLLAIGYEGKDPNYDYGDGVGHGKSTATFQAPVAEDEEATVFWLIFTLAGAPRNGAFRDYFGSVLLGDAIGDVADCRGAAEDVHRVNVCLARYEDALWVHLGSIGFNLNMVFYGAFMRLFATYLPATSCARFWDLLLAECVYMGGRPQQKPPRHSMIDLAFGVMRELKPKLLTTRSALEAKDMIVDYLERLYDPTQVIIIAAASERFLWELPGGAAAEAVGLASMHTKDYDRVCLLWEPHLIKYRIQNQAIQELMSMLDNNAHKLAMTALTAPEKDQRLTTKNVVLAVKSLRGLFATEQIDRSRYVCMYRPVPARIRKVGPDLDKSFVGTISTWFSRWTENVMEALPPPIAVSVPRPPEISDRDISLLEPTATDGNEFERQVGRVCPTWGQGLRKIFEAFVSNQERRISMNEFFLAMICFSRGTVGEKALGLFTVFGQALAKHAMHHVTPITHTAYTVVSKVDGDTRRTEGILPKAPPDPEVKKMALHFKVWTHGLGSDEVLMGEVFVPTLRPFVFNAMGRDIPQNFSIWGLERRLPPGLPMTTGNAAALLKEVGVRPAIGTMNMAIKWMPVSEATPEQGQLGLHLYYIQFDKKLVEAHEYKNPRVTVCMYEENGDAVQIKRWDPRSAVRRGVSAVTVDMAYGGAYGEHIDYQETMRRDPAGQLWHRKGTGPNHGWDKETGQWKWSNKWGDQFSTEGMTIRKSIIGSVGARPNTISLRQCRIITRMILARSLHPVTNRQAMHISDATFNRAGAVPGILDAILVQAAHVGAYESATQLKAVLDEARTSYMDVRHQVLLMHEETMDQTSGDITLFPTLKGGGQYNIAMMEITDPFPGVPKVLWIRYVRGGDGERRNVPIHINPDGGFPPQDIPMEVDVSTSSGMIQMSVTKEEFVTCVLSSPILSECLRQHSTLNNGTLGVPKQRESIKLDVVIADPTGEAEDDEFMDALNVRQGILLEVWDKDLTSRDDFLGECWLPPLSNMTAEPKSFVLQVRNAGSETRKEGKKALAAGIQCTGDLFVEAAWRFPHKDYEEIPGEDELEARVKKEEALHTGELYLKIVKATNLRSADIRRQKGSDPYVCVYVRNEAPENEGGPTPGIDKEGWRCDLATGLVHETIMKTNWKRSTVNPVWEEESRILLMTGSFERRTKKGTNYLALTSRSRQLTKDHHAIDVLATEGRTGDLKLYFGEKDLMIGQNPVHFGRDEGYRHQEKVFVTDSIHQFKAKLMKACEKEAQSEARLATQGTDEAKRREHQKKADKYKLCASGINFRHAVMVFVPSQRLRELAQQQRTSAFEYRRLYKLEEQDPSSWQPLDTIRTFEHYAALYGFGLDLPQRLRISEGTDDYKVRNTRYRQFDEEQKQWTKRTEDLNTERECFGWAKYTHREDGGSEEWRQVIIDCADTYNYGGYDVSSSSGRRFKTWFIHSPPPTLAAGGGPPPGAPPAVQGQSAKVELDITMLLPAPAHPRILGSGSLEHQEFLIRAKVYHAEGMSEAEIVQRLNAEMKEKYKNVQGVDSAGQPPPITAADVQNAIKRDGETSSSPTSGLLPRRLTSHFPSSPGVAPSSPSR